MKIIILGSKGNLGTQLCQTLLDHEIIAWDKEDLDITDEGLLNLKISQIKPDYIINCAAYNAVDKCEETEGFELAQKINSQAVGCMAQAALDNKAVFIHFSSDYVFGGVSKQEIEEAKKQNGFSEEDNTKPINKYAETKMGGEKEIISRGGKGLKYYLIRVSKLFGVKGESEFSKPSFFDIMLDLSKKDQELKVVDGEISCFTYMPDLARSVKDLIDKECPYGIYHIVNEGAVTWYEACRELFKLAGIEKQVVPISGSDLPRSASRPEYSALKNTKLKPLRSYQEALQDYLKTKN